MLSRLGGWMYRLLSEPSTRGLSLDDPALTVRRRELVRRKPALRLSYGTWYRELEAVHRQAPPGLRVELGSGSGFMDEHIDGLISTDMMLLPELDAVCRGEALPFRDASVGALFMVNVLHHVLDAPRFLAETDRVLCPGGFLAMVEPFVTPVSRVLYRHFHPEPFDPDARDWRLAPSGPLSGGNDALPWIIFVRDADELRERYPRLRTVTVRPHSTLVHLLSGGVHLRCMAPQPLIALLHRVESKLDPLMATLALFATIVVRKDD